MQDDFPVLMYDNPSLPQDYVRLLQRGLCWKPADGEAAMPTMQEMSDGIQKAICALGTPAQTSA